MKKAFAILLSALFVVALAVPVLATDARQIALGSVGPYIEDDFNIFTWYGTLPSYSNTVWIGLDYYDYYYYLGAPADNGSSSNAYIGASYALGSEGKYGTLAMFFSYYGATLNSGYWGWDYYDEPYSESLPSKWQVMYGYAMEKLSFGLFFGRSDGHQMCDYRYTYTDPDTTEAYLDDYQMSYTTIGAGVRFDIGEKMYADLAFDYKWAGATITEENYYYDHYYGWGEITADANKMMNFRGRMFYEWNEMITWVPYVNFGTFDFSLDSDSSRVFSRYYSTDTLSWKDVHYGVKGTEFLFGLGANIKVNENNLLLFAVEPYGYQSLEQSDPPASDFVHQYNDPWNWGRTVEQTYTVLPAFRLALESDVRDWLTFRIGGVKSFYKTETTESYTHQYGSDDDDDTEEVKTVCEYSFSDFNYWMGLGFHVGDFDIDAVVNNNLPFRIGYWLTGYQNNHDGPPVYMLSATYHF